MAKGLDRFLSQTQVSIYTTLAVSCLAIVSSEARAQVAAAAGEANRPPGTYEFAVTVGGGYSDNLTRRDTLAESGSYSAVGFVLDLNRSSRRVSTQLQADLEQRQFSTDLPSQPYGYFDASVDVQALPDRITWTINNIYGQGQTDPFLNDNPENREEINIFSTGPRFDFPIGDRTNLQFSSIASKQAFDASRLDSDALTSDVGIYRALSSTTNFGFLVSNRSVEYDIPSLDNDVNTAYLSYEKRFATGAANVSLGESRAEFVDEDYSIPFVDIGWSRNVGTRSQLSLSFTNQYQDAGQAFGAADLIAFDAGRADAVLLDADVYESSGVGVVYSILGNRSAFSVGFGSGKDRYENAFDLDNDRSQITAQYQRDISNEMQIGGAVLIIRRDFLQTGQNDDDENFQLWLRRNFARKLSLNVTYQHGSRSGANAAAYDENSLRLVMRYDFNPRSVER